MDGSVSLQLRYSLRAGECGRLDPVNDFRRFSKKIIPQWTEEEEEAKEYQLLGLSSITTNKPKIIKDYLLTSK